MPSARIWRCARQNFAGSAASSALPPRVLQEGVEVWLWLVRCKCTAPRAPKQLAKQLEAFLRLAHLPVLSPLKAPFVKALSTQISPLKSFSIQQQVVSDLILHLKSNSEGKHQALKGMNFEASDRTWIWPTELSLQSLGVGKDARVRLEFRVQSSMKWVSINSHTYMTLFLLDY